MTEALSRLIDRRRLQNQIQGFKINVRTTITHLFFADDTFIFTEDAVQEIEVWMQIFKGFALVLGLMINFDESSAIFSSSLSQDLKHHILQKMGYAEQTGGELYLGLPSTWGKSRMQTLTTFWRE